VLKTEGRRKFQNPEKKKKKEKKKEKRKKKAQCDS
jgi:hypothetical protein